MKNCVACAEEIQAQALLCKHCGTMQNDPRFANDLDEVITQVRPAHDFSSWVPSDTKESWRRFFESLTDPNAGFFADEIHQLNEAQEKLFLGVSLFKNLKKMAHIDTSQIVEVRRALAETAHQSGNLTLYGTGCLYIVKSDGTQGKETVGYFATGNKVKGAKGPICDVAIWIHCPRCTDILLQEDEDSDFPEEDQFPGCPACQGKTPVFIDFVGTIADSID